jgi:hypothetical protein
LPLRGWDTTENDQHRGGTDMGETRPAGEGVSDEEMVREVADQTSSDLTAEAVFEREADGTEDDTEAAKSEDLPD